MYKKGIEVMTQDIQTYASEGRKEDEALATRQLASAYASIADLYMTDLCDEQDAEKFCELALKEALSIDGQNIDALQSLGNLRMIRNKDDEAKKYLNTVYNIIMKIKKDVDQQESASKQLPSIDFRMQTTRLLVELQEFKKSVKILDTIIKEEDERVETWYLLGFCFCKLSLFQNALECIKNVETLIKKQKITNQEFLAGTSELSENIEKGIAKQNKKQGEEQKKNNNNEEMEDGYETYSEEDVDSDGEGEQDVEMK